MSIDFCTVVYVIRNVGADRHSWREQHFLLRKEVNTYISNNNDMRLAIMATEVAGNAQRVTFSWGHQFR